MACQNMFQALLIAVFLLQSYKHTGYGLHKGKSRSDPEPNHHEGAPVCCPFQYNPHMDSNPSDVRSNDCTVPTTSLNINTGPPMARRMASTSRTVYFSPSIFFLTRCNFLVIQKQPKLTQPQPILLAEVSEERKAKVDIAVRC